MRYSTGAPAAAGRWFDRMESATQEQSSPVFESEASAPESSDEDVTAREAAEQDPGCLKRLWLWHQEHQRHKREVLNHDMTKGINPYIRMKLGRHGRYSATKDVMSTPKTWKKERDKFINPAWGPEHGNELSLASFDAGDSQDIDLWVECMHAGLSRDKFIGACKLPLMNTPPQSDQQHILIPDPGVTTAWTQTLWHMEDHEISEEAGDMVGKDAGSVCVRWRWVAVTDYLAEKETLSNRTLKLPGDAAETSNFHGALEVTVMSATSLRDISAIKIADMNSFHDTTTVKFLVTSFLVYFGATMVFYAIVQGWWPWNAALFLLLTFSTVGYGNHADYSAGGVSLTSEFDRIVLIINIILGVTLLSVLMGVVADYHYQHAQAVFTKRVARTQAAMHKALRVADVMSEGQEVLSARVNGGGHIAGKSRGTGDHRVDKRMSKLYGGDDSKWTDEQIAEQCHYWMMRDFWRDQFLNFLWSLVSLTIVVISGATVYMVTEAGELYSCVADPTDGCHDERGCYIDGYSDGRNVFSAQANAPVDAQPDEYYNAIRQFCGEADGGDLAVEKIDGDVIPWYAIAPCIRLKRSEACC